MPRPEDERALRGWRELLEVMYTPEEAELASRMPMMPTPLSRLARRFDMTEEDLRDKLEPLCDKGLVMDLVSRNTGEAKYLLAPPVVGFFEFSMMRAHDMFDKLSVAKALDAYVHGDDTFAKDVFGNDTVIGRAMVHENMLAGSERTSFTRCSIPSSALGAVCARRPASKRPSAWSAGSNRVTSHKTPSSEWCGRCSSTEGLPTCSLTRAKAVARRS
jgi:hypothetical protein